MLSLVLGMARMRHACKAEGVLLGLVGEVRWDIRSGTGHGVGHVVGRTRQSTSQCLGLYRGRGCQAQG
jgi:hypothetical protein